MLGAVINIFRIPDLRNKVLFTVALLIIYRVGFHIPVPGFNQEEVKKAVDTRDTDSPFARAAEYMQMFTGGEVDTAGIGIKGDYAYVTAGMGLQVVDISKPEQPKARGGALK